MKTNGNNLYKIFLHLFYEKNWNAIQNRGETFENLDSSVTFIANDILSDNNVIKFLHMIKNHDKIF